MMISKAEQQYVLKTDNQDEISKMVIEHVCGSKRMNALLLASGLDFEKLPWANHPASMTLLPLLGEDFSLIFTIENGWDLQIGRAKKIIRISTKEKELLPLIVCKAMIIYIRKYTL